MPAVSKAQQRFMGMVHAAQKGEKPASAAVAKAADTISDKDAKDYASTKHKGLPDKVSENGVICNECDDTQTAIDYAPTKHDGEPDLIPQMKEIIRQMVREIMTEKTLEEMNVTGNVAGYNTPFAFSKKGGEKKKAKRQADLTGYTPVNENRWLELKNEVNPPHAKIGRGISNINKQLAEMERFLNWYGRIKQENGVTNDQFWKRTNHNIYKIKERLIKLEQQVRKIAQ